MFVDAQNVADGAVLRSEVCIVGAGAAGITLALAMKSLGKDTILLEAGSFDFPTEQEWDVYEGEAAFKPYPIRSSRLRYFGGTTNHWGGFCRPLDPADFDLHWPISHDAMIPWYAAAAQFCELSSSDYSISPNERAALNLIEWPAGGAFANKIIRHSPPTRFGERYRADIGSADQVRCVLGANVVGLSVQNTKISAVQVRTFSGLGFRVESRTYILALGGIENARFLLHTRDGRGKVELGNEGGNLGRCFADHFRLRPGMLVAASALKYHQQDLPGGAVTPVISASEAALRGRRFQNFAIGLIPDLPAELISRGYLLNEAFGTGRSSSEFWHYQCDMICEPSANPDSRITLGEERDALGLRRVRLDWRLAAKDFESLTAIVRELARTVGSQGIGRIRANERGSDPRLWYEASGGLHHMGTTRMGETAADGVVDSSCRVHGTDNLYVSGSSVFPGFGFANPTLTIVALALRLADHVKAGS